MLTYSVMLDKDAGPEEKEFVQLIKRKADSLIVE